MMSNLVLPRETEIFQTLRRAALERRCVFLAGLPGVGKSLLLQQLALIAREEGRAVHLLQWDVARGGFERPDLLGRYPEVGGVTHAVIRKAVGFWARDAVGRWDRSHAGAHHLLVGETPLIGNRLIELAQRRDDEVESMLAGSATLFFIPVPTRPVRRAIEASRRREMASPLHERERANAPPDLVRALWREIADVARRLGLGEADPARGYDPDVYAAVYRRLLRHRRTATLTIADVLPTRASPYELDRVASELMPAPEEVDRIMSRVHAMPEAALLSDVERWFEV